MESELESQLDAADAALTAGDVDAALSILESIAMAPGEVLVVVKDRLAEVVRRLPEPEEMREWFDYTIGYPLEHGGESTVEQNGSRAARITTDGEGRTIEACGWANGAPTYPFLLLDPVGRAGFVRYRSTSDSFAAGTGSASAVHGDGATEAEMAFERWRDDHLARIRG